MKVNEMISDEVAVAVERRERYININTSFDVIIIS